MALQPGSSVGTYEILAAIGSGGMGEVYRARDSRLKREVAIKSLPEAFARDADRLARFQREAEALAALNHPDISAIYGLEESGGARFLILELVEGETLQERLTRGAIPVDEALRLSLQIVEALEAAHEKGITHRDLKPANIKITPEGKIKVLDFGLARLAADAERSASLSNSPTMMSGTTPGMILGTAAYMSPEQAKGRLVDKRTDIFAFGAVLYEMLTGRQAFAGEDVADILSRVLQREPDWSSLPSSLPPRIHELLRLCLEKDARKRRRDAGDVRIDIEKALMEPAAAPSAVAVRPRSTRLAWIVAIVFGVVAMAALVFALRPAPEASEIRVDITTPATSVPYYFALSPDGGHLVFAAAGDGAQRLWLRSLDAVTGQPLPGTEGAEYPFWSPDGRSIAFFAAGKLKRIDIGSGAPRVLASVPGGRGGSWNSDGTILFAPGGPLMRLPASGGEVAQVTHLDAGHLSHRLPRFLPDGHQFIFYVRGTPDKRGIYLGSLDRQETKRLMDADTAGAYMEPGWLLYVRQGALMAQRMNSRDGVLSGDPTVLADSVGYDSGGSLGSFSTSATGRIAYRAGGERMTQLVWFDRTGKTVGIAVKADANTLANPALSPDGSRVAVDRLVQGNTDVWVIDTGRGGATRFTFDAANDSRPIWSPDGTRIAFQSDRKGAIDLYLKPSNGVGGEELLVASSHIKNAYDWSHDGRFLLYGENDPKTGLDLWALPMMGERKPIPVVIGPFDQKHAEFSPDGRWVAYQSDESGQFEIYVQPFPMPGGKWQVSTAGGVQPRWSADGTELFFINPDAKLMAAPVRGSSSTFEAGTPAALFQTRIVGGGGNTGWRYYAVSRDGRFLINELAEDSLTTPITLILNWSGEPK